MRILIYVYFSGLVLTLVPSLAAANPLLQRRSVDIKSITLADVNEEIKYHLDGADSVSSIPVTDSFVLPEGNANPNQVRFEGCDELNIVSEVMFTVECNFKVILDFDLDRSLIISYAENRLLMGKDDQVYFGVDRARLKKKGEIKAKISFWPALKSFNGDSKLAVIQTSWATPKPR